MSGAQTRAKKGGHDHRHSTFSSDSRTVFEARRIGERRSRRVFPTACAAHVSYAPVPALIRREHAHPGETRPLSIGAKGRPKKGTITGLILKQFPRQAKALSLGLHALREALLLTLHLCLRGAICEARR